MLTIRLLNDGTGPHDAANYQVTVLVNLTIIWTGRVEGHNRADGWPALVSKMLRDNFPEPVDTGRNRV